MEITFRKISYGGEQLLPINVKELGIDVYKRQKYMLVSGHKRIKACKYNIEHESELDGTGKVQKTIVATIVKN